jgi:hypothetical protein
MHCMQLVILFLLGLANLTGASASPASDSASTKLEARRTDGYRSVAYFVNWVSSHNIPLVKSPRTTYLIYIFITLGDL